MSAHCAPTLSIFLDAAKVITFFGLCKKKAEKVEFSALIFRFNWGSMDLFIHPFVIHRMQEEHP